MSCRSRLYYINMFLFFSSYLRNIAVVVVQSKTSVNTRSMDIYGRKKICRFIFPKKKIINWFRSFVGHKPSNQTTRFVLKSSRTVVGNRAYTSCPLVNNLNNYMKQDVWTWNWPKCVCSTRYYYIIILSLYEETISFQEVSPDA